MASRTAAMQTKLRVIIITVIAVLLCCAAVSVSYAKWSDSGSVTAAAAGGAGQFYVDYNIEAAAPDSGQIGCVEARNAVTSAQKTADGLYTYSNYVCVRRNNINGDAIALIDFSVFDKNGNELDADSGLGALAVEDFDISRVEARWTKGGAFDNSDLSGNGDLTQDKDFAPRIYNFPSKLADINRKSQTVASPSIGQYSEYSVGGTYTSVFFEGGNRQYCAMNVSITVKSETPPADIKLKAEVSNWDYRNRYKRGYGAPLGFYLGGNINGIDNWAPRYMLKLNGTDISSEKTENGKKADTNETFYKYSDPLMSEITAASLDYGNVEKQNYHAQFQYPTYIDVSMGIDLRSGSTIKMNMLDESGRREKKANVTVNGKQYERIVDRTVYFIPKNVVYSKEIKGKWAFVDGQYGFGHDLQLTEPGEYTFHYVGKVEYKLSGATAPTAGKEYLQKGSYINYTSSTDKTINWDNRKQSGTFTEPDGADYYTCALNTVTAAQYNSMTAAVKDGYAFIGDYNCLVDTLYITYRPQAGSTHTVSYVNSKGEGGAIAPPDRGVVHGQKAEMPVKIGEAGANGKFVVVGYFKDIEGETPFDFDEPINQDVIVYVEWKKNISIPSDAVAVTSDKPFLIGKFGSYDLTTDYGYPTTAAGKDNEGVDQHKVEKDLAVGDLVAIRDGSVYNCSLQDAATCAKKGVEFESNTVTVDGVEYLKVKKAGTYTFYYKVKVENSNTYRWSYVGFVAPPKEVDGIYVGDELVGALTLNAGGTSSSRKEYWLGSNKNITLANGSKLVLWMNKTLISLYVESNSTGVDTSVTNTPVSQVSVTNAGRFVVYLHENLNTDGTHKNWSCQFVWAQPEGSAPVNITFGTNKVVLYLIDGNGNAVGSSGLSNYVLYTYNSEAFGNWKGSETNGVLKQSMNGTTTAVPSGWIFRWGSGYANQTANIENTFKAGKTYIVKLPSKSGEAATVTEVS